MKQTSVNFWTTTSRPPPSRLNRNYLIKGEKVFGLTVVGVADRLVAAVVGVTVGVSIGVILAARNSRLLLE